MEGFDLSPTTDGEDVLRRILVLLGVIDAAFVGVGCGVSRLGVALGVDKFLAGLGVVSEILGEREALFIDTTRVLRGDNVDSAMLVPVRYAVGDSDRCVELTLMLRRLPGLGFGLTDASSSATCVCGNLMDS